MGKRGHEYTIGTYSKEEWEAWHRSRASYNEAWHRSQASYSGAGSSASASSSTAPWKAGSPARLRATPKWTCRGPRSAKAKAHRELRGQQRRDEAAAARQAERELRAEGYQTPSPEDHFGNPQSPLDRPGPSRLATRSASVGYEATVAGYSSSSPSPERLEEIEPPDQLAEEAESRVCTEVASIPEGGARLVQTPSPTESGEEDPPPVGAAEAVTVPSASIPSVSELVERFERLREADQPPSPTSIPIPTDRPQLRLRGATRNLESSIPTPETFVQRRFTERPSQRQSPASLRVAPYQH